jgi:hypothetical protein
MNVWDYLCKISGLSNNADWTKCVNVTGSDIMPEAGIYVADGNETQHPMVTGDQAPAPGHGTFCPFTKIDCAGDYNDIDWENSGVHVTAPCVDDPASLLASAGTSCAALLPLGCEYDLHEMNPALPAGSLLKYFCPSSCDICSGDGSEYAPEAGILFKDGDPSFTRYPVAAGDQFSFAGTFYPSKYNTTYGDPYETPVDFVYQCPVSRPKCAKYIYNGVNFKFGHCTDGPGTSTAISAFVSPRYINSGH